MSMHRRHITRVVAATAAAAIGTALAATPAAAAPSGTLAPLLPAEGGEPNGGYIVVLKNASAGGGTDASSDPVATAEHAGGREVRRYSKVLRGFSAKLKSGALDAVRANPDVAYVRADATIHAIETTPGAGGGAGATESGPPSWGLDRIDQRNLPLDQQFGYGTTGTGTTVFILDTGIRATHVDFGGRAQGVYNAVDDSNGTDDCNGHGTNVAGIVGGAQYGVAKNVQIRAVRVLDCDGYGTNADLIEGMDWVATHAPPGSVANFSLQHYGTEVDAAAENLIDAGVMPVFIAGNDNGDACDNNPRSSRGIVVGATSVDDSRWVSSGTSGSNFGSCVDIFAPGSDITSAGINGDTAIAAGWTGTSMAAPYVAGWVARYVQTHPTGTLAQAKAALRSVATANVLTNVGNGSPNLLLYADPGGATADTAAPSTPGGPAASNVTQTSAALTWAPSTDDFAVAGYDIQQAVGGGAFRSAGASVTNAFTATGLTAGTQYQFRMRARDDAGNLSPYSTAVSFTTPPPAACQVAYTINGSGYGTFTTTVVITNTGPNTIGGWTLAFTLPSGQALAAGWSATYAENGQDVTAASLPWNSTLNPHDSATIGFNGTGSGTGRPTSFTLNGSPCTTG